MRIHICFYNHQNQEVLNINDVTKIEFFANNTVCAVTTPYRQYVIYHTMYDRFEVDFI